MNETNSVTRKSSMQRGNADANRRGVKPLLFTVKIICKYCASNNIIKRGKRGDTQRYFCKNCEKRFQYPKIIFPYPCEKCGELITNAKHISKRFCEECRKKTKYEGLKQWEKRNREKCREYQKNKTIRKALREGRIPRSLIVNCQLCGKDIFKHPNALYCEKCRPEIRLFQWWYHAEEIEGRTIVKRSLIKNCLICGKDISMLTGQDLYCYKHKLSREFNNLGTTNFGEHMKRIRYGVPDFKSELKVIENHMKFIGLNPIKPYS